MEVVLHQLMISLQLSGFRIENDHAAGVEIVAAAVAANEVGAWVSDRRVKQSGVGVERVRRVCAAARLDTLRVIRPRLGGLARGGNSVEVPQALAGLGV